MLLAAVAVGMFAQTGANGGIDVSVDPVVGVGGGAVGAFATTLVVGAILVAVAPGLLERTMTETTENPVGSFVYGVVCLVFAVLVTVVLVFTIVGILVAIPFVILTVLIWAVGATVGFLTIAERLVGREDGWLKPLVVAAGLNGLLALTGIGGLVSFVVGAAGFGAVLRDYLG
jgi:hypothetical protein